MTKAERRRILDEVRAALTASDLQPAEVARRSGISKSALSRLIAGERGLSVESLEKLAPVLGLQIVLKKRK